MVADFKNSLQLEIDREKQNASRTEEMMDMVKSRIMDEVKRKEKVYYDRDELWDYEIETEQECKKIKPFFHFTNQPEIDYKSWDIKKSGGFLFGIGAKN